MLARGQHTRTGPHDACANPGMIHPSPHATSTTLTLESANISLILLRTETTTVLRGGGPIGQLLGTMAMRRPARALPRLVRASYQLRSVRLLIRRPSHIVTRLYRMCSFQRFTKQSLSGLCHTNMEGSDVRSRQPACTTSCPRPYLARHEVNLNHYAAALARLQRACGGSGVRQGHHHVLKQKRRCYTTGFLAASGRYRGRRYACSVTRCAECVRSAL